MDLTDKQWSIIAPLFEPKRRADGRSRPWREPRDVLNGVLWVLRTGAPWRDLPDRYPPYQTCHRRFQQWQWRGVLRDPLFQPPVFVLNQFEPLQRIEPHPAVLCLPAVVRPLSDAVDATQVSDPGRAASQHIYPFRNIVKDRGGSELEHCVFVKGRCVFKPNRQLLLFACVVIAPAGTLSTPSSAIGGSTPC
jgi:putative transposase of IS4/5 family DUF4096